MQFLMIRNKVSLFMETGHEKAISAFISAVLVFCFHPPENTVTLSMVAIWLIIVDTITGVLAAVSCKGMRSRNLRQGLFVKMLQYTGLLSIALGATVFAHSYIPIDFVYFMICGAEVSSILENVIRMQSYGGVNLGNFSSKINWIAGFFEVGNQKTTVVSNTMVIPKDMTDQPIISTVSVQNYDKGEK